MGQVKKEQEEKEGNWLLLAKSKNWKCSRCGNTPIYDEKDVFFETGKGLCGSCENLFSKPD